jgi:hypothetical protein
VRAAIAEVVRELGAATVASRDVTLENGGGLPVKTARGFARTRSASSSSCTT